MSKQLVVFYSWSGNTKAVAEYIREQTGADLLELQVKKDEYPKYYHQCVSRVAKYGRTYEPVLVNNVPDLTVYDTIFIGSPCWWGSIANPLRTFLHENDLSGKILAPFMTHGTSGLHIQEIKRICPDSRIVTGLGIYNDYQVTKRENKVSNMGDYRSQVDFWLKEIEQEK